MTKLEEIVSDVRHAIEDMPYFDEIEYDWNTNKTRPMTLLEFYKGTWQGHYADLLFADVAKVATRAVLSALKTPTPGMIEAGQAACEWVKGDEAADIYRAMIDAAEGGGHGGLSC